MPEKDYVWEIVRAVEAGMITDEEFAELPEDVQRAVTDEIGEIPYPVITIHHERGMHKDRWDVYEREVWECPDCEDARAQDLEEERINAIFRINE